MELPQRVARSGYGWTRFLFFIVLDTVLASIIALGPPAGLFFFLAPGDFFQRMVAGGFCGLLFLVTGIGAFFFWAFFITKTTNY